MSNLPQNPYASGPPSMNANAPQPLNHNQPFNSVPSGQLPPGYTALKQDANSSSPLLPPQNNAIGQVNNYNQSANSSPAFNHPGMMPPQGGLQSSPLRPTMKPPISLMSNLPNTSLPSSTVQSSNASPVPYPANYQQHQINNNALPLIPSSHSQSLVNGPSVGGPVPVMSHPQSQYAAASSGYGPPMVNRPVGTAASVPNFGPGPVTPSFGHQAPPQGLSNLSRPNTMTPPNVPFSGPSLSGPPRNSPLLGGPSVPPLPKGSPALGPSVLGPSTAGPPLARPMGVNGPSSLSNPLLPPGPGLVNGPGLASGPMGPPLVGPPVSGPPQFGGLQSNGPPMPPAAPVGATMPHQYGPPSSMPPPIIPSGPQNLPMGQSLGPVPPMGPLPMSTPPGPPSGPLNGPPKNNMQGRYPPMPQSNYQHPGHVHTQQPYPQQYHPQGLTQQMGQLSVTKQGFDQLWGHQMVDLMTCKNILPEYPEDPPEIRLGNQFVDSPNCSPEIFRCTVNKIPETNALLQKSRLPLGILIHPFKDLNHLPVIQCSTIVRCRACRTYINPFVYFVDAKRWKCNLCYRVNDLPEEFQYDPVSKSYGDPSRRPEIKSATIEFIAPAEYMLRPPQPAVYLFLMDVSQMARDSGYLQVLCDTLLANLDQLPGDARTQVGFICYDAHVHYYLMADGLTRPKEMTVLDVDDIFLPSPESLLVNLGERRALIRELLSALPRRHSAPQPASNSALGAALQAAYKLMAPTGGRVTVFQTCLPNVGPGALQPREDPNARSSAEVSHLNPATDFYKRLALECSGAQVAVDLFLLSAQYADLASLSGMSKFSAGTVYHIPVFRAARGWQAQLFTRMLTRYLTRKIGFEAVMRVRCTRGITIHTFHGNFFVRSTDLLSLPNVSPDAGFGMQLSIEESLADLQQVCFQAALLYTSSKGERRIRVHTMALPTTSTLPEVLHSADQQAIIGLLSKMASDRCASASMSEAREALMNVAVDALSAFRLAQNLPAGAAGAQLHAPLSLRVLPLYLLALLKRKAFRSGLSTRLDDRVADMNAMKTLPLAQLIRAVYPDLYPIHALAEHQPGPRAAPGPDDKPEYVPEPDPPRLHLSAERINSNGAYLLDDGETMIVYVCHAVSPAFLSETFGVAAFSQLPDEARALPRIETDGNDILHAFIDKLNDDRPYASNVLLLRDNSPNRTMFTERLVDDRVESAFAYYEFLQHIKTQVK